MLITTESFIVPSRQYYSWVALVIRLQSLAPHPNYLR